MAKKSLTNRPKAPPKNVRAHKPRVQNSKGEQPVLNEIDHETARLMNAGIDSAILGYDPGSVGQQLSQVTTLFNNNRWYLISNMRQLLSEIYVELGLVQTVIDVPVDDGLRGGITISTSQLTEEQIQEIENEMDEGDDITKFGYALKWNRLFGGAAVMIMTDQDPSTPLDLNALKPDSPLEFRDVDMWELFWTLQNTSDTAAVIDGAQVGDMEFYDYYGVQVHKSRVLRMVGLRAPSFIRPRLRGWGFSIMESVIRSINQYLKANNLTFEVLDEFKVDVYKIKNLTNTLMQPQGADQVRRRVALANQQKNFQHALVMDKEDDYIARELSFAGISETMVGIRMAVASDLRMPLTKVFGISAAGFSSGEDDIENYNGMVESQVRNKSKRNLLRLVQIRMARRFGFVPDDLAISFKPLRILSGEQEENVKTQKFNRVSQARAAGEISSKEYREAVNKDDLLPMKLDVSIADATLGKPNAEGDEEEEGQGSKGTKSQIEAPEAKQAKNSLFELPGPEPVIVTVGLVCNGYTLAGKRKDNGLWTNPGGHAEGLDLEGEACREVFEETGIVVKPSQLKKIRSERIKSHRTGKYFTVHAYIANLPERVSPRTTFDPDSEFSVLRWVPISSEVPELKKENRHAKDDFVVTHLLKGEK